MSAFVTLLAFVLALSILVAGHEWGHYRVAVACGVKVLRFSIGFGPVLWRHTPRRQHPGQQTEFVISAIPLGGYVKMLDEREGPVDAAERDRAFNRRPLGQRALVVLAGPVANLFMAVAFYALASWLGTQEPLPILSQPAVHTLADKAGLQAGDLVQAAQLADGGSRPVRTFEDLRWLLMRGALRGQTVRLQVAADQGVAPVRVVELPLSSLRDRDPDAALFERIGIVAPLSRPVLGELLPGGAAERAGLRPGDRILSIDGQAVGDAAALLALIRGGVGNAAAVLPWQLDRDGQVLTLPVQLDLAEEAGQQVGRLGAYIDGGVATELVRQGPLDGIVTGVAKTWDISLLSLQLLGRMVLGEVSVRNLSGPVAIAEYAGQSAHMGLSDYLGFLAFISVSLGILNLLPIPVLDGGHLAYYLWEAVTGREVAGVWLLRLQYLGIGLLVAVMSIAIYNDLVRWQG